MTWEWLNTRVGGPDGPDVKYGVFPIEIDRSVMQERSPRFWIPERQSALPSNSAERKAIPLVRGLVDYFPAALAEVAKVSKAGNDKHNPGEPLHHARGKSTDHADSIMRHLIDRGGVDPDTGVRHSAELAWRALALLQQELEDEGLAPLPRGATVSPEGNSRDRREALVRTVYPEGDH